MVKKDDTKGLRQETGLGMGNDPDNLVGFFDDQIPNPKFGEPGEPKYLDRPLQPGEVYLDEMGNEKVVPPAPEYKVGDRIVDPKTEQMVELLADGTWGEPTGLTQDPNAPAPAKEDTPPGQGGAPNKPEGGDGNNPQLSELQAQLQALTDSIQEIVPERLRRESPAESLEQLAKSYDNAEKKISEQGTAINKYTMLLSGSEVPTAQPGTHLPVAPGYGANMPAAGTPPSPGMTLPGAPSEEELAALERQLNEDPTVQPGEATTKLVMGNIAKVVPHLAEQLVSLIDNRQLASFRVANPEWDQLYASGDIQAVVNANRHLDSTAGLPEVLKRARINKEMREEAALKGTVQDPEAIKQQKEKEDALMGKINELTEKITSLEKGIPEAIEKVHTRKVKNLQAFTPDPNASGGGAAAVKTEEELKAEAEPQMSIEDQEFQAILEAQPPGRVTAKQDPQVTGLLAMMKGKVWNEDNNRFE